MMNSEMTQNVVRWETREGSRALVGTAELIHSEIPGPGVPELGSVRVTTGYTSEERTAALMASSGGNAPKALEIRGLSKSFEGFLALRNFDLALDPGEIHVLVGANGSGKSTLIKVLSGYHEPDPGGEVTINGETLPFGSPEQSFRLGCRFVHQDLGLVDSITVLDNLFMSAGYPTRVGTIRSARTKQLARTMLERVGLHIDPMTKLDKLSAAERTGVAVARALRPSTSHPAHVLVLDEPTAALPINEVDRMLDIVRSTAASGVAVLFVTHHLDEVFRIGGVVTVLRDSNKIATFPIADVNRAALTEVLIGRVLMDEVLNSQPPADVVSLAPTLEVEGLWSGPVKGLSFSARPGEVVGIAGLTGSGRETVLGAIFGAYPRTGGTVTVNGTRVPPMRPDLTIAAGAGLLPGDRKVQGGIMSMTARDNVTLADLGPFWSKFRLHKRGEGVEARKWFQELGVRPANAIDQGLFSFSGGNQQKILLAKWLRRHPMILLLDDPTQGVDVGAKHEVHKKVVELSNEGVLIVLSSTDTEELTAICTRVLVVRHGRICAELTGERIDPGYINKTLMSGVTSNGGEDK